VCGSWARDPNECFGEPAEGILNRWSTLKDIRSILEGDMVLVGHNLAYDLGVVCAADPTLVPLVFAKLDRDEAFDTLIAEQLIEIAEGTLGQGSSSSSGGGHSLEDLGRKYLGVDMSQDKHGPDAWRLRYAELDGIPLEAWPEAARAYPIRDARYTYDIAVRQIADGRNLHDLPAQVRAHWALHLSAMWGMRTDAQWVADFTAKVTAEHCRTRAHFLASGLLKVKRCVKKKGVAETPDDVDVAALEEAIEHADGPAKSMLAKALLDVRSGRPMRYGLDKKALEERVTAAYQGEPPVSAKGNIKTNKDTLKESCDKLLGEFAAAQDNEKFFSTYLKVLQQGTRVPINPRVNVLVASGRTSYSKPNLQNLPRGSKAGNPREGFVARDGYVYVSCDYPTLELRTLAFALEALGFESEMARLLRVRNPDGTVGVDLHAKLAAQIKGCSYDEFMLALDAKEKWAKDFRQMAKAGNFGLPGGLGAVKLVAYARQSYNARFCLLSGRATECGTEKHFDRRSKTIVCKTCLTVAQEIKAAWFEMLPEMSPADGYFALVNEWTSKAVIEVENDEGDLEEMSVGEVTQLVTERVRGRCNFTNGANTIFQGLAADIAKRALWLVSRESYCEPAAPLWGCRIVVFVHDELFLELPEDRAAAAAERVCRLMEQAFHEFCPSIPCAVEPALAWRWYKDAAPERDNSGAVVPVEKCQACAQLAPVGWDGVILSHKVEAKDGTKRVCAGVGALNVAVERRRSVGQ
jgi:DNA polymerase-1